MKCKTNTLEKRNTLTVHNVRKPRDPNVMIMTIAKTDVDKHRLCDMRTTGYHVRSHGKSTTVARTS